MKIKNNKKKKGFTMVELIAVMAIIAILSVSIAPRVIGYITEAKKTRALSQVREVVMAVDSYNIKSNEIIDEDTAYKDIVSKIGGTEDKGDYYIDTDKITSIDGSTKLSQMKQLVDGDIQFSLNDSGKIQIAEKEEDS